MTMTLTSSDHGRLVDVRPPTPLAALELLERAYSELESAYVAQTVGERFVRGHVSALRAAAAVIAVRGRPHMRGSRPKSVWVLLAKVAPELGEWAALFESDAPARAAVEAGRDDAVTSRQADDELRAVESFHAQVSTVLGIAPPRPAPTLLPVCGLGPRHGRECARVS